MKTFLLLISFICLLGACHKDDNFEQVQHALLMANTWSLDSIYITHNGLFSIDKITSPGFTRFKFSADTYQITQSINGTLSSAIGRYRFEGVTSRIYYWSLDAGENKDIYYNIQKLTNSSLVYAEYQNDSLNGRTSFVYFYHAL